VRRFVVGDIHGAHRALLQCFGRSGFNRQADLLISLGDLCDGWPEVDKVFDELLAIDNLILLLGNHDQWLLNYFLYNDAPEIWLLQGGDKTLLSFQDGVETAHVELLKQAGLYRVIDRYLFVHGGILPDIPLEDQDEEIFLWDRSLVRNALFHRRSGRNIKLTPYDKVFVGHTPTINFNEMKPIQACEICLMDTGAGWPGGLLTMMDIDSGEIFRSDVVSELYSDAGGRV
jgi:serine/threonine protein phosphatase 1